MTLEKLELERRAMHEYIIMKLNEKDYHAVADAAMDLRELEVEIKMIKNIQSSERSAKESKVPFRRLENEHE